MPDAQVRTRRPPPPFREVELAAIQSLSPGLSRATFRGRALNGFDRPAPAASVRLLIPSPGDGELEVPVWQGNEFLRSDGTRPIIRTFTPRYLRDDSHELDIDIVLHPAGAVSSWLQRADVGAPAAVSGPGRGYTFNTASALLLLGDETAIPAISQLIEQAPDTLPITAVIEITSGDHKVDVPDRTDLTVEWVLADGPPGSRLVATASQLEVASDASVWAAGEAGSMFRLRRLLFDDFGLPRSSATVRGYWKVR